MIALPVLPDHERIDLALRQAKARGEEYLFGLLVLVEQATAARAHEHYAFPNAADYLTDRLGLSHRSILRLLAIGGALERLHPEEREDVRRALLTMGVARAAIVAPAVGRDDVDWQALVERAAETAPEDLQATVSALLGISRKRAPRAATGGVRETLLAKLPPDTHDEMRAVFNAIMAEAGDADDGTAEVAALIWIMRVARKELEAMGVRLAA